MPAPTFAQLTAQVYQRLAEASGSPVAELATTGGGAPAQTSDAVVLRLLNEAAADMARSAYPVPGMASGVWPAGAGSVPFRLLTPGVANARLWRAERVRFDNAPLIRAERDVCDLYGLLDGTPGTPAYWYRDGEQGIGLARTPGAEGAVRIEGYVIPPPATTGADVLDWLPADECPAVVAHACEAVCLAALHDPVLLGAAPTFRAQYDEARGRLVALYPWMPYAPAVTQPNGS